jgi:hypothetical protein
VCVRACLSQRVAVGFASRLHMSAQLCLCGLKLSGIGLKRLQLSGIGLKRLQLSGIGLPRLLRPPKRRRCQGRRQGQRTRKAGTSQRGRATSESALRRSSRAHHDGLRRRRRLHVGVRRAALQRARMRGCARGWAGRTNTQTNTQTNTLTQPNAMRRGPPARAFEHRERRAPFRERCGERTPSRATALPARAARADLCVCARVAHLRARPRTPATIICVGRRVMST